MVFQRSRHAKIKPERKHEVEGGFDLRFSLTTAFSWAPPPINNRTTDAILGTQVLQQVALLPLLLMPVLSKIRGLKFSLGVDG